MKGNKGFEISGWIGRLTEEGGVKLGKNAQKRVALVLSTALAAFVATKVASMLVDEPEERGVEDDVKEALVQGALSVVATVASSLIIRNILSKRWDSWQ